MKEPTAEIQTSRLSLQQEQLRRSLDALPLITSVAELERAAEAAANEPVV
jgi:hypothetical protein